jgi:hypothetical protein
MYTALRYLVLVGADEALFALFRKLLNLKVTEIAS